MQENSGLPAHEAHPAAVGRHGAHQRGHLPAQRVECQLEGGIGQRLQHAGELGQVGQVVQQGVLELRPAATQKTPLKPE